MANLTLTTTFELTGVNLKDIKGSKSTTRKTFISRSKKKIDSLRKQYEDAIQFINDFETLDFDDFYKKHFKFDMFSVTREDFAKLHLDHYKNNLLEYMDKYFAAKNAVENGIIPDEYWRLWFAFDEEATKACGKIGKELYEVLSDGKDHNIRGEIVTGANQYEIISFEEF